MSLVSSGVEWYAALVWQLLKRAQIPLRIAAVIALVYLGYVMLARHTSNQRWTATHQTPSDPDAAAKFDTTYGGSAVKILQFYARDGVITDDQGTIICYGVVNAKSLRIDPPTESVYPALNRCLDVAPKHDTKYTLTATGNDGQTATAEFTVAVKPDEENLPKITEFQVIKHTVDAGKHYFTIQWAFANANKLAIDPPVFGPQVDAAPSGTWMVAPESTTTYTLTVTNPKGRKASKKLTVDVPKG
jgi:hypothetical protein